MTFIPNIENKLSNFSETQTNKVLELSVAINEVLKPQITLHFACVSALPYSSIREIVRQAHNSDITFDVISLGSASQIQMLVSEGLVSKLITSYVGDVYPRPSISPIFQRAFDTSNLEIEQWSLLSLCLRLYAGALGLNFIPTSSIVGSTMAKDNTEFFKTINDPFDSNQEISIVKNLIPDFSFVHAWVSDPLGNALIYPPFVENLFGCFASKNVILTTERIVKTEDIRKLADKHQNLAIPSGIVKSVSESPFGGHPGANYGPLGSGYDIDLEFLIKFREAAKETERINAWMEDWIHNTTEESYLQKVGIKNLTRYTGQLNESYWRRVINERKKEILSKQPATKIENMICVAAQIIKNYVKKGNYNTILAGQGASNLAAWLAKYSLQNSEINLLAEAGMCGYLPKPASPYIFEYNNIRSSTTITDSIIALGMILRSTKSLGVLGAGQIDQYGNINSTKVHSLVLFGSGGANDVGANAEEVIVLLPLKSGRFPKEVPYTTVSGKNVTVCVTTEGIFEKLNGVLTLTGYIGKASEKENITTNISDVAEWDLKIYQPLIRYSPPSPSQLQFLRSFDPNRYFLGRFS